MKNTVSTVYWKELTLKAFLNGLMKTKTNFLGVFRMFKYFLQKLKLWLKPKSDCKQCCLTCPYWVECYAEEFEEIE